LRCYAIKNLIIKIGAVILAGEQFKLPLEGEKKIEAGHLDFEARSLLGFEDAASISRGALQRGERRPSGVLIEEKP